MNRILHQHEHSYMKLHICIEQNPLDDRDEVKALVASALLSLHGQVGASLRADVLQWLPDASLAILRVPHSGVQKVWSALTLLGEFHGEPCAIQVLQVSSSLCSLAIDHCVAPDGTLLQVT
eukprot:scpid74101/ scgid10617/ 